VTPTHIIRVFAYAVGFGLLLGALAGDWGVAVGVIVGAALAWPEA
jgi:hypothetical protein